MSFIKNINGSYYSLSDLENVVNYCVNSNNCIEWEAFGVNGLNSKLAANSMLQTKKRLKKTDGKQLYHFVLSIYRRKYYRNEVREINASLIMNDVGNFIFEQGFQSLGALHKDKNNIHIHFVVNSVSGFTGLKLNNYYALLNCIYKLLKEDYRFCDWEYIIHN